MLSWLTEIIIVAHYLWYCNTFIISSWLFLMSLLFPSSLFLILLSNVHISYFHLNHVQLHLSCVYAVWCALSLYSSYIVWNELCVLCGGRFLVFTFYCHPFSCSTFALQLVQTDIEMVHQMHIITMLKRKKGENRNSCSHTLHMHTTQYTQHTEHWLNIMITKKKYTYQHWWSSHTHAMLNINSFINFVPRCNMNNIF